jgi:hypothetical protein
MLPGLDGLQPLALGAGSLLVQPLGARYPVDIEKLDLRHGTRTPFARVVPADPVGADPFGAFVLSDDGRTWAFTFNRRLSELFLVEGLR